MGKFVEDYQNFFETDDGKVCIYFNIVPTAFFTRKIISKLLRDKTSVMEEQYGLTESDIILIIEDILSDNNQYELSLKTNEDNQELELIIDFNGKKYSFFWSYEENE